MTSPSGGAPPWTQTPPTLRYRASPARIVSTVVDERPAVEARARCRLPASTSSVPVVRVATRPTLPSALIAMLALNSGSRTISTKAAAGSTGAAVAPGVGVGVGAGLGVAAGVAAGAAEAGWSDGRVEGRADREADGVAEPSEGRPGEPVGPVSAHAATIDARRSDRATTRIRGKGSPSGA